MSAPAGMGTSPIIDGVIVIATRGPMLSNVCTSMLSKPFNSRIRLSVSALAIINKSCSVWLLIRVLMTKTGISESGRTLIASANPPHKMARPAITRNLRRIRIRQIDSNSASELGIIGI
jgi:hypothetical protein